MTADVRYEPRYDPWESGTPRTVSDYLVRDRQTGRLLGWVEHFAPAWYAWSITAGNGFICAARTRREATDLILGAS